MKLPRTERLAWAAAADVLDLPSNLADEIAREADLAEQLRAVEHADPIDRRSATQRMLDGDADPVEAARADTQAAEDRTTQRRSLAEAAAASRFLLERMLANSRESLIVDVLRPALDELLDQAEPLADSLAPFAPTFDADAILNRGDADQLAAWQDSRPLHSTFRLLVNCWMVTWKTATSRASTPSGFDRVMCPDAPGGLHAWQRPRQVDDVDVRDGRNRDLLAVATWRTPGGWRLASHAEMLRALREHDPREPWLPGERTRRRVLVP